MSIRNFICLAVLILTALMTISVRSEEHSAEPAAAATPTAALPAWQETETKVQELASKVKAKEADLMKLIETKKVMSDDSPELKKILEDIVKEHKEYVGLTERYKKNVDILKFRYPERTAGPGIRRYEKIETRSLEELEQAVGVDAKLERNMRRMKKHYSGGKRAVTVISTTPTTTNPPKRGTSIEDEGSILIKK